MMKNYFLIAICLWLGSLGLQAQKGNALCAELQNFIELNEDNQYIIDALTTFIEGQIGSSNGVRFYGMESPSGAAIISPFELYTGANDGSEQLAWINDPVYGLFSGSGNGDSCKFANRLIYFDSIVVGDERSLFPTFVWRRWQRGRASNKEPNL